MTGSTGTVFRGDDLPAEDRFDCWRELVGRTRDSEMTSAHAHDFEAEMRRLELGPVTLLKSSFPPARFRRSARRVRQSDREVCHLTLVLGGSLSLTRDPRAGTNVFEPGELTVLDSSHPYDVRAIAGRATEGAGPQAPRTDALGIDFPMSMLPLPRDRVRDLMGRGYSGHQGTCALLADFLVGLDRQAALLGPAEAPRLGAVVIDLVAAWLARELDAEAALPDDGRQRALVENVRTYIGRNLHDPELSPPVIAAAHHISVSYLHRVFTQQSEGETVAAWIRRQRLERARQELADPALRALPVQAVAARWGLPRASDFSRAFRAAYGVSPSEHRRTAAAGKARDAGE
ncbi:helix-turn-helix domain-containing protein [Streptomyces sp. SP17BM10]|uniref:helix-turn-helix domain-containing protein n=1 Tax=Streptomyces sp. SP17BM10 TaxID=3002530 RepID=UPI002E78EF16|nr:helix-turn-helix domain-containing protein [Streptomyces sp. SP17BM10]MEE1784559.1 helix-turn-helix domain-containing protein [Streptomyces sp. SP17BM10]